MPDALTPTFSLEALHETRTFDLGNVIATYSGIIVTPKNLINVTKINEIWHFLTGKSEWKPEEADFRELLDKQLPFLAGMMPQIDKFKNHAKRDQIFAAWLTTQKMVYGETVTLRPLYVIVDFPILPEQEETISRPGTNWDFKI